MRYYLLIITISALVLAFSFWKNKKEFGIRKERYFDFVLMFAGISFLISKFSYLFTFFEQIEQKKWSFYPYVFLPGAERIWFTRFPWYFFRIWDSLELDMTIFLLIDIIVIFLFIRINKINSNSFKKFLLPLTIVIIIQILISFIGTLYYGKETSLFIGYQYNSVDQLYRYPVQFIEILAVIIIFLVSKYFIKTKKLGVSFYIYIFLLSCFQIFIYTLRGDNYALKSSYNFSIIIYLILALISLVFILFNVIGTNKIIKDTNQPRQSLTNFGLGYRNFQTSYNTYEDKLSLKSKFITKFNSIFHKRKVTHDN